MYSTGNPKAITPYQNIEQQSSRFGHNVAAIVKNGKTFLVTATQEVSISRDAFIQETDAEIGVSLIQFNWFCWKEFYY